MAEKKWFSVKRGQLVQVRTIEFLEEGTFRPILRYAVVMFDYTCDYFNLVDKSDPIHILFEKGEKSRTPPIKIEFITDLSTDEQNSIRMDILLSS